MGTRSVERWVPTDAWIEFKHKFFIDLENSDDNDFYEESLEQNSEDKPSGRQLENAEDRLREMILERGNENLDGYSIDDLDQYEIRIKWSKKSIEVCEWCNSPTCEGDPDECDETPEYCLGCENYTGGNCDCVYCEHCDEWNNDCDHSDAADVTQIVTLLASVGFETLPIELKIEEGKEEETVL